MPNHGGGSQGEATFAGGVGLKVIRPRRSLHEIPPREWAQPTILDLLRAGCPLRSLSAEVNTWRRGNLPRLLKGLARIALARKLGICHFYGSLYLTPIYADGRRVPLGLAGVRVVTDTGVAFLVDAWQNIVELEIMKFHGLGTGVTAEAQTQTALVTELTTEYTGNVRATGSTTEGGTANVFRTVGTNTLDATPGAALREHGIFSASTAGVMWDRTLFAAITLSSGDSLQSTYDLTAAANG